MSNFKVLVGKVAGKVAGEILTESDLKGANIEALIKGGNISPVATTTKKKEEEN
jgi:hypothetical protein